MTAKKVIFDNDLRKSILKGASQVADAVRVTIGPRGQNVVLDKGYGGPRVTNDGVSIAKEIELKDKFENIGAEIVKEVANKTNEQAGDGTSTATILTHAILEEGYKKTSMGANPVLIRQGIEKAAEDAVEELNKISKKIKSDEEITAVASISAESEELGKTIAETIKKVGKDGVVTVEESQSVGITSEVVEGLEFSNGYISPYMVTDGEKMIAEMSNPSVLLTDKKISSVKEILPFLENLVQSGKKDLVIIADDVEGEALTTFILNKLKGGFNVLAIKAPGYGDNKKNQLEDLAILLGGQVVSEEVGMNFENIDLSVLGEADKIISTKDKTTIVGGKGKKGDINARIEQLKNQMENIDSKYDKEKIAERIAKLSGGVAVIKVGAATETEIKYLRDKIDDAVNATKAAIAEGIVPGGGTALVKISENLSKKEEAKGTDEFSVGYRIFLEALKAPFRQIVKNAGRDDAEVLIRDMVKAGQNYGFDATAKMGEVKVVDMLKEGIIDPAMVERVGMENAASAASTLLTTQAAVAEIEEEKDEPSAAMGGGMPMM